MHHKASLISLQCGCARARALLIHSVCALNTPFFSTRQIPHSSMSDSPEQHHQEASAKRKRLSLACNVCRRKKIKCDGVKPTCGKCERFHQECTYTDVVKKRGPRQGHIDLLEQRLRKMEELITTGSSVLEASPSSLPIIEEPINKPAAATQPACAIRATTVQPPSSHTNTTPRPALALPKPTPDAQCQWPAMDVVQHLVDIYFMHFETLSPIADVKGFKASILNKTCSTFLLYAILSVAARFSKRPDIVQHPLWMAGEKFAEIARSMLNQVVEAPSMEHVQGLLILNLHEYGCARNVRCWMYSGMAIRMAFELNLENEMMFEETPGSVLPVERWFWYENRRKLYWDTFLQDKLSSAMTGKPQMMDHLDSNVLLPIYNSSLNLDSTGEFYQQNLDGTKLVRYNVHRSPTGIVTGVQMTPVPLSTGNSDAHLFSQVGLESRTNELYVLLGRIARFVNRGFKDLVCLENNAEFDELNRALDSWEARLPHHLKNSPANLDYFRQVHTFQSGQFVLAHMLHNTLVVLLNRPSLILADMPKLGQVTQAMQDKVQQSKEKCLLAADNVTIMLKDLLSHFDIIPPSTIYFAYTTATVMVNNSFSVDPEECKKCDTALQEYYKFFEVSYHWLDSAN
ncbi:fungal-specific transcription factor domain-containing protein [Mucor lusitanicus]|uniref:Fungal-specific transcription factor domain-containing protein n=1 Tax=Mucor circinelloides f. lusitanicus TaxID=29924 RepID=A0A8H4BG64_MUCCL|nr:fungal-specific transcription factor domain-containing protein [Mucor lusitanicus]